MRPNVPSALPTRSARTTKASRCQMVKSTNWPAVTAGWCIRSSLSHLESRRAPRSAWLPSETTAPRLHAAAAAVRIPTKLTALPGAETNLKHTDFMATKSKSKIPRAPAVDRAAAGSAWLYEAGHCLRMDRLPFGESAVILPEVICIIKAADEYEASTIASKAIASATRKCGHPVWVRKLKRASKTDPEINDCSGKLANHPARARYECGVIEG